MMGRLEMFLKHEKKAIGAVLFTDGVELLVLKPRKKGYWEIPKGKFDEEEKAKEGAAREFYEETGIKINTSKMTFLKKFRQRKGKLVMLFIYEVKKLPPVRKMKDKTGKSKDEIADWMYITDADIHTYVRFDIAKHIKGIVV